LWVRGELLGDSWWLERHGFPMLVELPSGKEDFGIGEPVGEEDFGSFNDLVGGDEPLVHVGMQRGREALARLWRFFRSPSSSRAACPHRTPRKLTSRMAKRPSRRLSRSPLR
jgi:hypothetical protein